MVQDPVGQLCRGWYGDGVGAFGKDAVQDRCRFVDEPFDIFESDVAAGGREHLAALVQRVNLGGGCVSVERFGYRVFIERKEVGHL